MSVGFRSPFAFWVGGGGVAEPEPTTGPRSLLAPWVGGAGVPASGATAGQRSLLAPWVGGAGATTAPPAAQGGYASLLGFWVGGAGATADVITPPAPPAGPGVGRRPQRVRLPAELLDDLRLRRIDEDDVLLLIAAHLIATGSLH